MVATQARDYFELMRKAVEELYNMEEKAKPMKMDISHLEAAVSEDDREYSHAEWVEHWEQEAVAG